MALPGQRIGEWQLNVSRRTGQKYWSSEKAAASLWHDESLPHGWGWTMEGPQAPKFYVNLLTGARQNVVPRTSAGEDDLPSAPPAKRARVEEPAATTAAPAAPAGGAAPSAAAAVPAAVAAPAPAAAAAKPTAPSFAAPAAAMDPGAMATARLPSDVTRGFFQPMQPDEKPTGLAPFIDESFFRDPHKLVLGQCMQGVAAGARALAEHDMKNRGSSDRQVTLLDVGAGTGAATRFLLEEGRKLLHAALPAGAVASVSVYSVDAWHRSYYSTSLRAAGATAAADALDAAAYNSSAALAAFAAAPTPDVTVTPATGRGFEQFCINFWGVPEVTPIHNWDFEGVRSLSRYGITPALAYIDCDLHADRLQSLLTHLICSFPGAIIVGGGWELSAGVRAAVSKAATEVLFPAPQLVAMGQYPADTPLPARRLHVEEGQAWTLSGERIRATKNKAAAADISALTAEEKAAVEALRIDNSEAQRIEEQRLPWIARVIAAVEGGTDDVNALRTAVGTSASLRAPAKTADAVASAAGAASSASAAGADGRVDTVSWINSGDQTRYRLTPLMHAAKRNRLRMVRALVQEHGANINQQAERSLYTALQQAAFSGHLDCVKLLLELGANPTLADRHGETALRAASNRRYSEIVKVLEAPTLEWAEREKRNVKQALMAAAAAAGGGSGADSTVAPTLLVDPGPDATVRVPIKNGATCTIRAVTPADQGAVARLYAMCQQGHAVDMVTSRIHERWAKLVLSTDLADVHAGYMRDLPRSQFWVATVSKADYAALAASAATAADGGSGAATAAAPLVPPATPDAALVDAEGNVVVGCVGIKPRIKSSDGSAIAAALTQSHAELQRMCSHPALRRCGIASLLLGQLEQWAIRAQYSHIHLETMMSMFAAVSLYQRLGYECTSPPGGTVKSYYGDAIYSLEFVKRLHAPTTATAAS